MCEITRFATSETGLLTFRSVAGLALRRAPRRLSALASSPLNRLLSKAFWLGMSLLALHGCASGDATQLVVLMDTDYLVPDQVDRLHARISKTVDTGDGAEEVETWNRTFRVGSDGVAQDTVALPATFAVIPADGDIDSEIIVDTDRRAMPCPAEMSQNALARNASRGVRSRRSGLRGVPCVRSDSGSRMPSTTSP